MEEYLKTYRLDFAKGTEIELQNLVSASLLEQDGVLKSSVISNSIFIEYNPYKISESKLKKLITEKGIKEETTKKSWFLKRWIQNLAKTNKKNIGNRKMDCCNLNH